MKIVFFGSTEYSVKILERLKELNHHILVICSPDKRKGRHLKLQPCSVKTFCIRENISFLTPHNVNSPDILATLREFSPDIFLVCEYGQIFKEEILKIPKIMPINIHLSLLPKYRGPAPVNWAIIKGESETGITFHRITLEVDKGEIIYQQTHSIKEEVTAPQLHLELIEKTKKVLIKVLEDLKNNNLVLIPQDETKANYAPKLRKEDGLIDWNDTNFNIFNKIRGLLPWPVAFSFLETGLLVKFFKAQVCKEEFEEFSPLQIVEVNKNSFKVKCGKGVLEILELQPASKRKMSAREFICGYRIKPGMSFTSWKFSK